MSDVDSRPVPAYSITEVEILDENGAAPYAKLTNAGVAQYDDRFLVLVDLLQVPA